MRNKSQVITAIILACSVGIAVALAQVLTLKELFQTSNFVAIVTVVSIEMKGTEKYGIAKVHDVWKGPSLSYVKFRAYPSWQCDTSDAKLGDHGLMMFDYEENGIYGIANSGQGSVNLNYKVSRITKDRTVLYHISDYDLLTEKEIGTLTPSALQTKSKNRRDVSLNQLKHLLKQTDQQ